LRFLVQRRVQPFLLGRLRRLLVLGRNVGDALLLRDLGLLPLRFLALVFELPVLVLLRDPAFILALLLLLRVGRADRFSCRAGSADRQSS